MSLSVLKSLKSKFVLVITLLVLTLLGQVVLSNLIQKQLINNEKVLINSYSNIGLVHEIERNLVDLQRVLLVYKETSSDNSSALFSDIMEDAQHKLLLFKQQSVKSDDIDTKTNLTNRMQAHLEDFADNFKSVLETREMQEAIHTENILPNFALIRSIINSLQNEQDKNEIRYLLELAEQTLDQYLISPDYDFINKLKGTLTLTEQFVKRNTNLYSQTENSFTEINKAIAKLTTITRGYVFLVNVVMTGSANEFLLLTKTLREDLIEQQLKLNRITQLSADESQLKTNIATLLAIFILFLISYFLTQKILKPINKLTTVFSKLSKDENLTEIPETNRDDEIGALANSAEVFQRKNLQTSQLLLEAQQMNFRQEELNAQLEVEKERAESAAKSKAMFLANMSHEIRTPMNGIIGLVELLKVTRLSDQQKDYVSKVAFSGNIMMNVINDILDFSKIEAGKLNIELIEFKVDDLIENIIATLKPKIDDRLVNFRVNFHEDLPAYLIGDPLRISQIILNLCNNSIKFTKHGSIELTIEFNTDNDRSSLDIKVTDTGIGMSADQLNGIFDSFIQADGSTSRKYGGTGLGLSIVKQLSLLMGGDVSVSSQKEKGTTFIVSLVVEPSPKVLNIDRTQTVPFENIRYIRSEAPLLSDNTLDFFTNNLTESSLDSLNLDTEIFRNGSNLIVVEIDTHETYIAAQKYFTSIKQHNLNIAFICNNTLNDIRPNLDEAFPKRALFHPFSPSMFSAFFESLALFKMDALQVDSNLKEDTSETISLSGHILIVEDNQINQLVAGHMIQNFGLTYDIANNGVEAVEKVLSGIDYSLVLMDVQMPIMDGYQATQEIRKNGFDNLIICGLSANAMKQDSETAKQAGMNEYFTKPIEVNALKNVLIRYLKS